MNLDQYIWKDFGPSFSNIVFKSCFWCTECLCIDSFLLKLLICPSFCRFQFLLWGLLVLSMLLLFIHIKSKYQDILECFQVPSTHYIFYSFQFLSLSIVFLHQGSCLPFIYQQMTFWDNSFLEIDWLVRLFCLV